MDSTNIFRFVGWVLIIGFFVAYALQFQKLAMRKRMFLAGISAISLFAGGFILGYVDEADKTQVICLIPFMVLISLGVMFKSYRLHQRLNEDYSRLKKNGADNRVAKKLTQFMERFYIEDDEIG